LELQMELGGKDAAIVCADADIEAAAKHIVKGAFSYSGQRCTGGELQAPLPPLLLPLLLLLLPPLLGPAAVGLVLCILSAWGSAGWSRQFVAGFQLPTPPHPTPPHPTPHPSSASPTTLPLQPSRLCLLRRALLTAWCRWLWRECRR
jgi:hypothetical protein